MGADGLRSVNGPSSGVCTFSLCPQGYPNCRSPSQSVYVIPVSKTQYLLSSVWASDGWERNYNVILPRATASRLKFDSQMSGYGLQIGYVSEEVRGTKHESDPIPSPPQVGRVCSACKAPGITCIAIGTRG